MRLSQEVTIFVRKRSADFEGWSRRLVHNNERNSFLAIDEEAAERVFLVTAERYDLFLLLNDCKLCTDILVRKLSKEEVFSKTITVLVNQLGRKLISIENDEGELEENTDKLMRQYDKEKILGTRSVMMLLKGVATRIRLIGDV